MICGACQSENPADHQFCSTCGHPLAALCEQCGHATTVGHAFCGHCGHKLSTLNASDRGAEQEGAPLERRQLTLLFCDLVGSTDLSARLDPEDYGDALQRYHERADQVIARHGGYVAQHLGDGVLAYFGWPVAYDDAAERAIRAGLDLVTASATVEVDGVAFAVRIGLHTGAVVVGGARAGESLALGSAPNIAARVQSVAAPGSVCITAATQRLVAGLFIVEELGAHVLKGIPQPIELYRVIQPSGVRGRFGAAALRGLTPFVNRTDERQLMRSRFERACDAQGQYVLIVGEAGIGKSRLAHVLRDDIGDLPHTWLETAGVPQFANTPFHAVTQLLNDLIGAGNALPTDRLPRLTSLLASVGLDSAAALSLVAPLLDVPVPETARAVCAPAALARKRLLTTLSAWLFGSARRQPLVLLVEDLQWTDPSTLELLQHLIDQCANEPVLVLCTARPEFVPPWPLRSHHTTITLNRLRGRYSREMVSNIAARSELLAEVIEQVVTRTGGVPLFIEELTRSALETGTQSAASQIPATLADSLMARLDRLGQQAKEVAQVGAVCGHEFTYGLLHAVHPLPEPELDEALRTLVDAELLYARGIPPDATYTFKHALVQDAALEALLKSRRRVWHARVAAVLREQFPAVAERHPELLAPHDTEAGEVDRARAEWQRAAERAITAGALREAVRYLESGLELLRHMDPGPERDAAEFPIQLGLGRASAFIHGYSAPETVAAYRRARLLGERIAEPDQLVMMLIGLFIVTLTRDGPGAAHAVADELTTVADHTASARGLAWAQLAEGLASFHSGEFAAAYQRCVAAHGAFAQLASHIEPVSPVIVACSYCGYAAWHLGLDDEARRYGEQLRQRTAGSERASDRAWGYSTLAVLNGLMLGDRTVALNDAAAAIAACAQEPNPIQEALAKAVRGWIIAMRGENQGLVEIDEALHTLTATEQQLGVGFIAGLQVDAYAAAGKLTEALRVLDEWDSVTGEENLRAGVLHRRAEVLGCAGVEDERVEHAYQDALACARAQGAYAFEVRAAVGYARWLDRRGRRAAARALLASYDRSTQASPSRYVVELRELLESFSASGAPAAPDTANASDTIG